MRRRAWCAGLVMVALAGGCAHRPGPLEGEQRWSGRLALRVEGSDAQSFTSAFELSGSAGQGELRLFTPLGSTAAQIRWANEAAWLVADGETRRFDNLDQLMRHAAGVELPVATLFDWLAGRPTPLAGWSTDLSGLAEGRLLAQRLEPAPVLRLRVLIDPPSPGATN